jgi:hypothetical protein
MEDRLGRTRDFGRLTRFFGLLRVEEINLERAM